MSCATKVLPLHHAQAFPRPVTNVGAQSRCLQRRHLQRHLHRRLPAIKSVPVKDETSGVEFPLAQKFWEGDVQRCLGTGTRSKRFLFVDTKVYSIACYVEAEKCARELGIRFRGGCFDDGDDDSFCTAILDGAFHRCLLVRLVRTVSGEMFTGALNDTLAPRMQLAGEMDKLKEFESVFAGKSLEEGTEVAVFWNVTADTLSLLVTPPQQSFRDYANLKPDATIKSMSLCRALFEVFLGESSVVPKAKAAWANGARNLLESEIVRRQTRQGGEEETSILP